MSGEDDDAETGPRRRVMTGTERDLKGLRDLQAKKKRPLSMGDAIPGIRDVSDDTGVTQRIEEDDDLRRLFKKAEKNREAIIALAHETANRDIEIAGEKPPDERFKGIERNLKFVHLVIVLIAIPVVTSTVLVAKYIYNRGMETGTSAVEQRHTADDIAEMKREIADGAKQISDLRDAVGRLQQRQDDLGHRKPAAQDASHTQKDATTP